MEVAAIGTLERLDTRYREDLEKELRETFSDQKGLLYSMLAYQLGWLDDQGAPSSGPAAPRLHPLLCLLSCEAIVGKFAPALPAAAAVELVHNYSLIHLDVQSGIPNTGHRPSVWWLWGPGQAINAGDGMQAFARLALTRLQETGAPVSQVLAAMRMLDLSCLQMCEGQHLDLAFQERLDVGISSYFKMVEGKAGALPSCSMGLGGLMASDDVQVVDSLSRCGMELGVAAQILQDVRDLWPPVAGEAASPEVLNKKKMLPIVHALETGSLAAKRELGNIYFKRVLEPDDAVRVAGILETLGSREFAESRVEEHRQAALDCLASASFSQWGKATLEQAISGIAGGVD